MENHQQTTVKKSSRQCAPRNVHWVSGLMVVHSMNVSWLLFCSMLSQGQLVAGFGKWK